MKSKRKGFTLFETLIAALILTIVGGGLAGVYMMEGTLLLHSSHRAEAVNYAASLADKLLRLASEPALDWGWGNWDPYYIMYETPAFSLGNHNEDTDPEICQLADSYFKLHLKGTLRYQVEDISVSEKYGDTAGLSSYGALVARRVDVIVEWEEAFPRKERKSEHLYIAATFYFSDWM
ncbi:MAG: prepilin-type N-terminal cleavage/methylation domain-containing protein [Candidatus Omnitrophica bacterium]|nr:prepilin-type N-terminal cleavage/methylation domain-containing protein [Candidatus Omnitrophota bacterium]